MYLGSLEPRFRSLSCAKYFGTSRTGTHQPLTVWCCRAAAKTPRHRDCQKRWQRRTQVFPSIWDTGYIHVQVHVYIQTCCTSLEVDRWISPSTLWTVRSRLRGRRQRQRGSVVQKRNPTRRPLHSWPPRLPTQHGPLAHGGRNLQHHTVVVPPPLPRLAFALKKVVCHRTPKTPHVLRLASALENCSRRCSQRDRARIPPHEQPHPSSLCCIAPTRLSSPPPSSRRGAIPCAADQTLNTTSGRLEVFAPAVGDDRKTTYLPSSVRDLLSLSE